METRREFLAVAGGMLGAACGLVFPSIRAGAVGDSVTTNSLNTSGSVILDGAGHGVVKLGPAVPGVTWRISTAAVKTNSATNIPTCSLFMGAAATDDNFVDGTYTGNQDSTTNATLPLTQGQYIFAVWVGGDVGAQATLSLIGQVDSP